MARMTDNDARRIRESHRLHVKTLRDTHDTRSYDPITMNLSEAGTAATRTLTIVLPESEWQALRAAEPDAIGWLQAQIRRRLGEKAGTQRFNGAAGSTADSWADDEY
jgi:hypothetical protein